MKIRRSEVTFVLTCLLFLMAGKVAGQAMDDDPTFAFEEAMQLLRSGDESKSKQAAQQLKKLAVDGHSRSQYWLAQLYFQGLGVGQSDQQGRLWIQRSAETGYAVAKLAQAEILLGGDEAAKDYEKARGFLEGVIAPEAASTMPPEEFGMYRNSKARASYLIGMFYQNGWGVELDKSKAVELFQLASRTGDKDASMMLAIAYAKGDGVERDAGRTKEYFELYDLQSVDEVNRSLENAIGGSEDSSDRQNLAETSKYLSEAVSSMVSAMQTEFAREVLEEGGEDYDPAFAATLLNLASENGYAEARMRLGLLCYRGLGVEEDKARASELFQLASEADWTLAQYNFAGMLLRGEAEAPKGMTARELLRKAATSGLFLAQVALEDNEADVSPVSPEEARDRCLEAAEAGDARAIYSLAIRKQSGWLVDVEEDFSKVVDLYRQSADSGYSRAQYVVGLMQMTGGGMPVDPMAGIARIRSAAYADLPEAIYTMGECYVSGIGVQPDPVEAYNHFLKASKLGYRNANNRLAAFHYYGILVPQNEYKAAELYLEAADEGDAEAAQNLGNCYLKGLGVSSDTTEGIRWLAKSAELGNMGACHQLAHIYQENLLVDADPVEVAYWIELAAEMGDKASMKETGLNYFLGRGVPRNRGKAANWMETYQQQPGPVGMRTMYLPGEYEEVEVVRGFLPGDYVAQLVEADLMAEPDWSGSDRKRAIEIYERLASNGAMGPTLRLAKLQLEEGASSRDAKKMVSALKGLYEGNRTSGFEGRKRYAAEAAYLLSRCSEQGFGVKASTSQRMDWLEEAARLEFVEAQYELGSLLEDPAVGAGWLVRAAKSGDTRSQMKVARIYLKSPILELERDSVISWLKAMVDSGSGEARVLLRDYGVRYKEPEIRQAVPEDEKDATDPWAPVGVA